MDHRLVCLTLFLVLLVDTARGKGCGLSAFRHVPGKHCRGYELVVDRPEVGSVLACAKACCDNPACKSFQYSTYGDCYLISKICTDEEKVTVSIGNMYDRIQGEARPQASAGCGLSAFRHVPRTYCLVGYENVLSRPKAGSADACAKACCDNPDCKSFQYTMHGTCSLLNKICTDEEKVTASTGNMYDRIQAAPPAVPPAQHAPGAWRDDLRCGARYPAPNGQSAICNPDGKYPCCAPSGWCGKTTAHCACSRCVDYRKASKRMVEARETLQDLRDVLLDLEEAAEIEQETRELEDMEEDAEKELRELEDMGEDADIEEDPEEEMRELEDMEEDAGLEDTEKEVRELEDIEENAGMAEDDE
ncbi:uncharacterized protein LOC144862632 [Branchiostoma floridae x Branchiostoma japonicum]